MLAVAGVEAMAIPGPPGRVAPEGEDIIIIPGAVGLANAYAATPGSAPLATLAGLRHIAPPPIGLNEFAGFTGAIALDAAPALLAAQLAAFQRDGVAEEERNRRRATASALGATGPKALEPRPLKAVYIGAPSPKFLRLESTLAEHGGLSRPRSPPLPASITCTTKRSTPWC